MNLRERVFALTAVAIAATGLCAWGEEKKIELDEAPAKVREAIKAKWPKAKVERAATDKVGEATVYGFELTEGTGPAPRHWVASFTPDGKLREMREELKTADIPKSILQALQKKYPSVKHPSVERITESEGKSAKVTYEMKFAMQVSVDGSGKITEEKELDFDLEDPDE